MKKLIAALLVAVLCTSLFAPALAAGALYETTKSFIAILDENDLAYGYDGMSANNNEEHIYMDNEDENFAYTIHLYFHEDNDRATVFIWNIIHFDDADFSKVLRVVNELNYSYKYIRFYIDESDNTVTCSMNLILHDNGDAGDIVLEALLRVASILKLAYPQLAVYDK